MKEFSQQKGSRSSQIDVKFLQWLIQTLWERSGKASKGKENLKPNAVAHIDANALPEDILSQLPAPMHNKIHFLFTGMTPLHHDDEVELIDEMLSDSLKLHEYLPVLFALANTDIIPKVPPPYVDSLGDVLKSPRDGKREAQVIFQYDNIFSSVKAAISKHNLPSPPLFSASGDEIDRTALIYFNHKEQVGQKKKQVSKAEKLRLHCCGTEEIKSTRSLFYDNFSHLLLIA